MANRRRHDSIDSPIPVQRKAEHGSHTAPAPAETRPASHRGHHDRWRRARTRPWRSALHALPGRARGALMTALQTPVVPNVLRVADLNANQFAALLDLGAAMK